MNTPAHLLLGWAVFGKRDKTKIAVAAVAGAALPDASLYLMSAISIWVLGFSPGHVFGVLYYSPAWQAVFAVDNSFVLWGLGCLLAWRLKSAWAVALTGAALLHLACDFPLHTHDARAHFWPLTLWRFEGPVSYWDSGAYANIVGPIVLALCCGALWVIWRRHRQVAARAAAAALLAMEMFSSGLWRLVF